MHSGKDNGEEMSVVDIEGRKVNIFMFMLEGENCSNYQVGNNSKSFKLTKNNDIVRI